MLDDYLMGIGVGERVIETGNCCRKGKVGVVVEGLSGGHSVRWNDGMTTSITHGTKRIMDWLDEMERT